jgi:hypothetical protein
MHMTPIGPSGFRRLPEPLRRQMDVAAAAAWEALVEVHTGHALRFVALMAARLDFDDAVIRYLDELDVREPMASAIRSRVLVALEHAIHEDDDRPALRAYGPPSPAPAEEEGEDSPRGLGRFRPDALMRGLAKRVRETGAQDEWVRLAVARAEEGVIKAHVDNAVMVAALLEGHIPLSEAVEEYLELMRIVGGRAQSVHQRTMARLAELHLPAAGESRE